MRITRRMLEKVIRDTVAQRVRVDRNLVSIYLCGSLLGEEFLLGGATDIDLVFIHLDEPPAAREIVRLTDEIHLDIAHHRQKDYRNTRQLRVHPWLGPTLFDCQILHDPQHFMDFTQASVRGQYDRSEYVLERVRSQAEHARQIWFAFFDNPVENGPEDVGRYLKAVVHAANAVASLTGPPLTERRLLMDFQGRAEEVGRPGLYAGLLGLLGAPAVDEWQMLEAWIEPWQAAYRSVPEAGALARLHPDRETYYTSAFRAYLDGGVPLNILWPLLNTWNQAAQLLPDESDQRAAWLHAFTYLGLAGNDFAGRIEALDAYLDTVEELIEDWARARGVS